MKSDLEIAREATLLPIDEIAKEINIPEEALLSYGPYIAKIDPTKIKTQANKNLELDLVTAMSPTPAGEGKTTTTIGLSRCVNKIKKEGFSLRSRAIFRACIWYERGCNRWGIFSSSTNGEY